MKKSAMLLAGLTILLALSAPAYAQAPEQPEVVVTNASMAITPRYTKIKRFYANAPVSSGYADISAGLIANNSKYKASLSVTL